MDNDDLGAARGVFLNFAIAGVIWLLVIFGASMDASNPDGLSHCGRPEHPSHPMALGAQPAGRPSACFKS